MTTSPLSRAEHALRESEAQFRLITDSVPALIAYVNTDQRFRFTNKAYAASLQTSPTDLSGKTIREVLGADKYSFIRNYVEAALAGRAVQYEMTLPPHPNNAERYGSVNYVPDVDSAKAIKGFYVLIVDMTERKRAEEELRTSREQLRALAAHRERDREEERTAIARDLHDDLGQTLTALKMEIALSQRKVASRGEAAAASLDSALKLVDVAIDSSRRITTRLRPEALDHLGLADAIEWHASEFSARSGVECGMQLTSDDLGLDDDAVTGLFRIVQETLTNVARHAGASRVDIRLATDDDAVELEIRDNGCGVREDDLEKPTSFGILGMKERAQALGGMAEISGLPDEGTTVRVRIGGAGH